MKRILCFIDSIDYGGAQRQFLEMVTLLREVGYKIHVIFYEDGLFFEEKLIKSGAQYQKLKSKGRGITKYLYIAKEAYKYIKAYSPDVVISYLMNPTIIACFLKGLSRNYKMIGSERNTTQSLSGLERLKFWSYRFADVIVPNSHAQEQFIKEHYPKLSNKLFVITNCVDTQVFTPNPNKDYLHDTFEFICVGRVKEQKNIIRFIKVIDKLRKTSEKRFHVTWFGDINDDYGYQCKSLIETLGLEELIEFKPTQKNIQIEYQKADALCLPSIYEGFPNVIGEAMSCGLPILCSNVCDNATLVDGANGMLFNPFDEDDMLNTAKAFLSLKLGDYEMMGKESREKAIQILSKEAFVNKYKTIIER